ncbi:MAG: cytochrome c oxidase subunit II [Acidimicrobiales bacterium]
MDSLDAQPDLTSPRRPRCRSRLVALVLWAALAILLAGCAQDAPLDTLKPKGPAARDIDNLSTPVFVVAGVVFVIVNFGVLYIAVKFRRRPGDEEFPEQIHGNTKLELGWTIAPGVVLLAIAVATVATLFKLADTPDDTALTVRVEGQQWWWRYIYDTNGNGEYGDKGDVITANELVMPAGQPVALKITSNDVIHSFWIPALNGKKDAVPGRVHDLWFEADEPGRYLGQCTEFCGLSHANMRMVVDARSPAEFERWLLDQQADSAIPPASAVEARRGLDLFVAQCARCHEVRGVNSDGCEPLPRDSAGAEDERQYRPGVSCWKGANGNTVPQQVAGVAPDLTHLMSRATIAGSILPLKNEDGTLDRVSLEEWLRNPPGVKAMAPDPSARAVALSEKLDAAAEEASEEAPAPASGATTTTTERPRDLKEFGRGMPNLNLTEEQIDDLVAYLSTLQ